MTQTGPRAAFLTSEGRTVFERLATRVRQSRKRANIFGGSLPHQQVSAFRVLLSGGSVDFDVVALGIYGQRTTSRFRFRRGRPRTIGLVSRPEPFGSLLKLCLPSEQHP